jgi:hypothetical protein
VPAADPQQYLVETQSSTASAAVNRTAAHGRTISALEDLPTPSGRVRHIGGYLRDESPDGARGRQDVDIGIADMCGDRLPEHGTAAAAVQQQPFPEVGALG